MTLQSYNGNTFTTTGTQIDDFIGIDIVQKRTSGGRRKTITSGKFYKNKERVRVTGAQLKTLFDLITDGSNYFYYTPTNIPDYLTTADFPKTVIISGWSKSRHVGGGDKRYIVDISFEGSYYL